MRIGIACHPGQGAACIAATLANGLATRGHEVHLLSYATPRPPGAKPNLHVHEVATPSYPVFQHPPYLLALATKMAEVSREHRLALLHLHGAIPHALAALTARKMAINGDAPQVVTTLHGSDIAQATHEPRFREPVSIALRHSDGLTAPTQYLAARAAGELEVCANRVSVVPAFVDRERYRPWTTAARAEGRARYVDNATGEMLIVHYSHFRSDDRTREAIEAFSRLRADVPAKLVIVGEGPERYACRLQVGARGRRDDVLFLDNDAQLCQLFPLADIALVTTALDYTGVAALEAMSSGLPVVAYDGGGATEMIDSDSTGCVVPPGDVDGLTSCLLEMATDADRRERTAAAAREATAAFDAEAVVARYEACYDAVCPGC